MDTGMSRGHIFRSVQFVLFAMAIVFPGTARAQCGPQWLPGDPYPGVDGTVECSAMWDPDGAGPLPARLVVGGLFRIAGDTAANNIAMWDGQHWYPFGSGTNERVRAVAVGPNNELVAGGDFTAAGGQPVNWIAQWNGAAWSPIGAGMNSSVYSMSTAQNGDLVVGGNFTAAGSTPLARIGRWNGTTWSSYGAGSTQLVRKVLSVPGGQLLASGTFPGALGGTAFGIALWTGSQWVNIGNITGVDSPIVNAIAVSPQGDILIGGAFYSAGGVYAPNVAILTESQGWRALGEASSEVKAVAFDANGAPVAGPIGASGPRLAVWNGQAWSAGGTDLGGTPYTITRMPNGTYFVGGNFSTSPRISLNAAIWSGTSYAPVSEGNSGTMWPSRVLADGRILVGGSFRQVGSTVVSGLAVWDGVEWGSFTGGVGTSGVSIVSPVYAFEYDSLGRLIVGGSFSSIDRVPVVNLATWTGQTWLPMGNPSSLVDAIARTPSGDIYIGGSFSSVNGVTAYKIARWDGTTWYEVGGGMPTPGDLVRRILVQPNSDIIVSGGMRYAGGVPTGAMARWNGSQWSGFAAGFPFGDTVASVVRYPNGDLLASGSFSSVNSQPASRVARWDGTSWSPLGSGVSGPAGTIVWDSLILPSGEVVSLGNFTSAGGIPAAGIAHWNGSTWSPLGSGFAGSQTPTGRGIILSPHGELVVTGDFTIAGGKVSTYFARWTENPVPWVARQPHSESAEVGSVAIFSATVANGFSGVSVQWYRNGQPIQNGPGGSSFGGATISGATATFASPTSRSEATLVLDGVRSSDRGTYTAVFSNQCGSETSALAELTVTQSGQTCFPDLNDDGVADQSDLDALLDMIASGQPLPGVDPDFNRDGNVDAGDLDALINVIAGGDCPS